MLPFSSSTMSAPLEDAVSKETVASKKHPLNNNTKKRFRF